MWKKVLYLGVTIIFGFLVYIMSSNSNQINHLESLVKKAIESERFHEVPMIWDGCFDTTSIVKNESENMDIVLYPATSQTDITYGPEDNTSRFLKFERAYYLYIFNTEFSLESVTTSSDASHNYSGIEFSTATKSYTYYFIVNDKTNSSSYEANPTTKEQAVLNGTRDVTNTNSVWNFMRITFTETMLNQIVKELGGEITKLSVKDSEGTVQYTSEVKVDFSQNFFTDVKPLFDNYNVYLDEYVTANGDKNKVKEAQNKFNEFYNPWFEEFESTKEETKYTFRFDNDVLSPSKLIWQTVGIVALYIFVIALGYVLLFHFKDIKRLFSREKKYTRDNSKILVNGKWVERSSTKMEKSTSEKAEILIEPDTKVDETLETLTATEIIAEAIAVEPKQTAEEKMEISDIKEQGRVESLVDEKGVLPAEESHSDGNSEMEEKKDETLATPKQESLEQKKSPKSTKVTAKKTTASKQTTAKKSTSSKSTATKSTSTSKKPTTSKSSESTTKKASSTKVVKEKNDAKD